MIIGAAAVTAVVFAAGGNSSDPSEPGAAGTTQTDETIVGDQSTTATAGSVTTGPSAALPGIDPAINWRRVAPEQFEEPGSQLMVDVAVFEDMLVAVGRSIVWEPADFIIPLADAAGEVTLRDWRITVAAVDMDAAAAIVAHDPENEPAPADVRYIMVRFDIENLSGEDDRNFWADVEFYVATPDGSVVAWNSWCGSLPDGLEGGSIDAGETISGTDCFAMHETWLRDDLVLAFVPDGERRRETDAAVWTSSDGEQWKRVADPDLAGAGIQEATNLAVFGDWLYAAGLHELEDEDGAIWRSSDGVAWDRVDAPALAGPGDQEIRDLIVLDGTMAAAGSDAFPVAWGEDTSGWDEYIRRYWLRDIDSRRGAIWITDDGVSWRALDLGATGSTMREIVKLVWHEGRLIAIGYDMDQALAVITTTDIETWEPLEIERRDTTRWRWEASGVAAGRLHVLGTGALSTADGITWAVDGYTLLSDVVPAGNGLLGVGWSGSYTRLGPISLDQRRPVLRLLDGDGAWYVVRDADLLPEGVYGWMRGVVAWQNRYVAVGTATVQRRETPAVWIGGAAEGETVPDLEEVEMTPPDLIPDPPAAPLADIIHFDGTTWNVVHRGYDTEGAALLQDLPEATSRRIARSPDGTLWLPTVESGVYALIGGEWRHFGRAEGLPSVQVTAFDLDSNGTPWAGTVGGPAYFDGSAWVAPPLPNTLAVPHVTGLAGTADGAVWVATVSGVARWDPGAAALEDATSGLPSTVATNVLAAGGQGVWVITPAGIGYRHDSDWGVFAGPDYRPDFGSYPYASPLSDALYLAPDPPGDGEYRSDLVRLMPDGSATALIYEAFYTATTLAPDGTLFVGTELNGLFVIGATTEHVESINGINVRRVGELWTAPDGKVWMDTFTGLFEIHEAGSATRHIDVPGLPYQLTAPDEGFSDGAVADMAFGPDGEVWALVYPQLPEWDEGS